MTDASTKLKEPSFLLAASNARRMIRNLDGVLDEAALEALRSELERNVVLLFRLGQEHLAFADDAAKNGHWRQAVSRAYYGAYNARRAVALEHNGHFSTTVADHKGDDLPKDFQDAATHANHLTVLRDDRNLADYSHLATKNDLVFPPTDAVANAKSFCDAARNYLRSRGVKL